MSHTPPPLPSSDATGTTQSAGQSIDEGRGRIFPCEQCGADLVFNIGQQKLKCPYCGFEKEIGLPEGAHVAEQDLEATLERLKTQHAQGRDDQQEGQSEVRCESCGATVVFVGSLTSDECPYCTSPIQRDKIHQAGRRIPVDGVLPFLVPEETAAANLKEWVQSRWFAPNDFLRRGVEGKFHGVYLPFWTYDAMTATHYTGARGEHYWVEVGSGENRRRVMRTRWWPASGSFQRFFDDVLVLAARKLNPDLMQALEPWPMGKCRPFSQELLAGFLARTYEIELDEGLREAKQRMDAALEAEARQRIGGDEQRITSIQSRYDALTFKHLLLPTWLMSYRWQGEVHQVMVNAATGEVQGERPYSWIKITLFVLLLAAIALTVWAFSQR